MPFPMEWYSLENLIFQSNHRLPFPSLHFMTSGKYECHGGWLIAVAPSLQSSLRWSCHPDQLSSVPSLVTHQQNQSLSQSSCDKAAKTDTAIWQAHELETSRTNYYKLNCTADLPIFLFLISVFMTEQGSMELDLLKMERGGCEAE